MKCPKCHSEDTRWGKFCNECGHSLTPALDATSRAFSFTEKLAKIERYLPRGLTEKILAQKGKIGGERRQITVMFCFRAPIALENASQRALWSALSIHNAIAKCNDLNNRTTPIKMRIGVHTGPVVVGTLGNDLGVQFSAVGDTVNLASRREGLAEPGTA